MSQHDPFEHELAAAMRAYVADAPTQIDASEYVGALVVSRRPRRFATGIELPRESYRWVALVAALVALLIAVLAIGTGGRPTLFGDAPPSGSPPANLESREIAFIRSGHLWLLRDDASEPVTVVEGRAPRGSLIGNTRFLSWSPDGSMLAMASADSIILVEADTLTARNLPDVAPPRQVWGWTPDSRALLTRSVGPGGSAALWATDVGTGISRQLSSDPVCQAVFSPDGSWIAATQRTRRSVVVASAQDFEWAVIGAHSGYDCGPYTGWDGPTWSADSNRVAFISGFDGGVGGSPPFETPSRTTITVAGRDGTGSYQLTDQAAAWGLPKWSPDGAWIAYRSSDGLRLIRPDGTGSRLIFGGVVDRGRIGWASDSMRLDFGVTRGNDSYGPTDLWSYDLSTDSAEPIAVGGPVHDFARRP